MLQTGPWLGDVALGRATAWGQVDRVSFEASMTSRARAGCAGTGDVAALRAGLVAVLLSALPTLALAKAEPPPVAAPPVAAAPTPVAVPAPSPPPTAEAKALADQIEQDKLAGVAAFEKGDYKTALERFRNVRKADPNDDEAMFLLGRAFLANDQPAAAAEQFSTAIATNDKVEKYYYARAKADTRLGQYAAALADFTRDLDLRGGKGTPIYYLARGDAYLGNGQNDMAIRDYKMVLSLSGDAHAAYLHKGVALARGQDLAHALEDFDAAEAAGKSAGSLDFDTYFYRGAVRQLSGDKAGAFADYQAALQKADPRAPMARCLARAVDTRRHSIFDRGPPGCDGVSAQKALLTPPTP